MSGGKNGPSTALCTKEDFESSSMPTAAVGSIHPRAFPFLQHPPPEVPVESVVELSRSNRRQGLDIDRMSGLPGWYGESLDLNRALEALRHDLDT
jgi:hypothetical protein